MSDTSKVPQTCAVYVHWPYCARICPYCDFNVHKRRDDPALLPAILEDLSRQRTMTGPRRVTSLHFGGGTPSLMDPADVDRVIARVSDLWTMDPDAEIGMEANPSVLDGERIRGFAHAGVNRLSFGVQTFDSGGLARLGRDHSADEARDVVADALTVLANVSLDLMFGWAGQTLPDWSHDLDAALDLGVPHVSAYQLTIEADTAYARAENRGQARSVDADLSADMYALTVDRLTDAGFDHYEVSNFAKPGHRSRHNLAYWRGRDYVGAGPGAHGRITTARGRIATIMPLHPAKYAEDPDPNIERLSDEDVRMERVMMGLRTVEGIDADDVDADRVLPLVKQGLLQVGGDRVATTPDGRRVLDYLLGELLT